MRLKLSKDKYEIRKVTYVISARKLNWLWFQAIMDDVEEVENAVLELEMSELRTNFEREVDGIQKELRDFSQILIFSLGDIVNFP